MKFRAGVEQCSAVRALLQGTSKPWTCSLLRNGWFKQVHLHIFRSALYKRNPAMVACYFCVPNTKAICTERNRKCLGKNARIHYHGTNLAAKVHIPPAGFLRKRSLVIMTWVGLTSAFSCPLVAVIPVFSGLWFNCYFNK